MSARGDIDPLGAAFDTVRAWLDKKPQEGGAVPETAADSVAQRFGLDSFGRNILLLCAYAGLEPDAQAKLAELLGDPAVTAPTVGLALARLPGAHWQALAPDAPLRRMGLVDVEGQGPVASYPLRICEPVLFALVGAPSLGTAAAAQLRPVEPRARLAANRVRLAQDIAERLSLPGQPVLHLIGTDPEGKLAAFAQAAAGEGQSTWSLSSQTLPATPGDLIALCRDLARDLTLTNARLVLVHDPISDDRLAQLFAETYAGPLAVISTEALRVGHRPATRLEMPVMSAAQQRPVWDAALGELGGRLTETLPRLAATFRVAPEVAESIAAELTVVSNGHKKSGEDPVLARAAWEACRRAARPRMDDLAQRIDSPAAWDDLIVPPRQRLVLASIVAQVRNRTRVYEDWGFAPRLQNKGLGISALFSGPSGVGKSMAGEVIGNALDLDVYRVDLSAMVSKWVGETEKNLRRVFDAAEDGGVILQFDEADALFGRRSEVKDSHDRHANIEVSYLLQRLEAYRGLCILTTNLRDHIDEAFMRRIRFAVEFRFPSGAERLAIWRRVFPGDTPQTDLDLVRLAQLNVSGGSIRNIALGATFLAADQDGAVTMADLYQAARQEYDKVGRSMTDAETAGWRQ